ncbi:uncharacterized protein LOC132062028 [Lycium ferocissimum]|uniref:uncharacterized protein LOC132062028 n=1 Tax=Lycium ferocissimum TaxID=112874 RepID=UPI002814E2A5|nr:uncharacterized protein LOC132062028 [Lycium ferocissimum]
MDLLHLSPDQSASKVGWFRNEDADDLLKLIQEVSRYFSSAEDIGVDPSNVHPYVSKVLRSFCSKLRMDRVIAAFQIKAGYFVHFVKAHPSLLHAFQAAAGGSGVGGMNRSLSSAVR